MERLKYENDQLKRENVTHVQQISELQRQLKETEKLNEQLKCDLKETNTKLKEGYLPFLALKILLLLK